MKIKGLYAIIETEKAPGIDPVDLAVKYLEGGARIIQWRQKKDPEDKKFREISRIAKLKSEKNFIFIINDDPELAVKVGADGVHVGQGDMPVADVRRIVGPGRIIGKSNHSIADIQKSLTEDIDYVALGGIFPTASKPQGHPVLGLTLLKEVVRFSPKPVVAIGGINRRNIAGVIRTGVSSIAVITALSLAKDPVEETRFYVKCLG